MPDHPEPGIQHPPDWRRDLNPDATAGTNMGASPRAMEPPLTAYDVKDIHRRLSDFTDDDLKRIPLLREGERLEQGATYLDLRDQPPREVTAIGGMIAGRDGLFVPKNEVDYRLWNRLLGLRGAA